MSDDADDRWVTLFAANDDDGRELVHLVLAWCRRHVVSCLYRDAGQQARDEYNVKVFPTLRFFNHSTGEARIEITGADEIKTWLSNSSAD
jgi:hypothetical protein